MSKLTKKQRNVLIYIQVITKNGGTAHVDQLHTNKGVMERLLKKGLIKSNPPFMLCFHSVTLTEAGRAALKEQSNDR